LWRNFGGQNSTTSGARAASTEPVGPSGFNANTGFDPRAAGATVDTSASRAGTSGLTSNNTLDNGSSGLGYPGNDGRTTNFADRNPSSQAAYGQNTAYGQNNAYGQNSAYAQAANPNGVYSQQEQMLRDRQAQFANQTANTYGQPNPNQTDPLSGFANARDQQRAPAETSPDSRLTAAEIAAGAWTVDIYNRPVDRAGRLIPTTNQNGAAAYDRSRMQLATQPNPQLNMQAGLYPDRTQTSLGQPSSLSQPGSWAQSNPADMTGMSNPNIAQRQQSQYEYNQALRANAANATFVRDSIQPPPSQPSTSSQADRRSEFDRAVVRDARDARDARVDPPSLTERRTASVLGDVAPSRQTTAQPLFNFLLLISFVANIYLIFWLKKLRLQFRDMVAAKRMANANSAA
jgi:hypothetical protein